MHAVLTQSAVIQNALCSSKTQNEFRLLALRTSARIMQRKLIHRSHHLLLGLLNYNLRRESLRKTRCAATMHNFRGNLCQGERPPARTAARTSATSYVFLSVQSALNVDQQSKWQISWANSVTDFGNIFCILSLILLQLFFFAPMWCFTIHLQISGAILLIYYFEWVSPDSDNSSKYILLSGSLLDHVIINIGLRYEILLKQTFS